METREMQEIGEAQETRTIFGRMVRAFGLHNLSLYRKLLRNEVAGENRRAFSRAGIDYDAVRWQDYLEVPEFVFAHNREAFETVVPLLQAFDDIKPFAHYAIRREDERLETRYGLDPRPLFNFDDAGADLARGLFPGDLLCDAYPSLSRSFVEVVAGIREGRLLGENTGAYFAILRHWAHYSLQELEEVAEPSLLITGENLLGHLQAMRKLVTLLYMRYLSVPDGSRRFARIRGTLDASLLLYLRMSVLALLDSGYGVGPWRLPAADALPLLADEVCAVVRKRFDEAFEHKSWPALEKLDSFRMIAGAVRDARRESFHLRYHDYDETFLYLGDEYGDCTANKHVRQLNPDLTNIHWTVYAWLLNPYYRVLEVCGAKGDGLVKAHVTPLVIHDRKVLMVDAIESVAKLRAQLRGVENKNFDRALFDGHAEEIFQMLMEHCIELGRRIGAEAVYSDLYSNSLWINQALSRYPTDSYHIREVEQTFGDERIAENVKRIRNSVGLAGDADAVKVEIQAVNCRLMEQYTRYNHKEVAVLDGLRLDWRLRLRGV